MARSHVLTFAPLAVLGLRPRLQRAARPALGGLLFCGLAVLFGCRAPAAATDPTAIVLNVPDYEAFWDASLSVLRRYDFPPDRADPARGLIVSDPATSGQWFEWWRVDSQGAYQTLESSLHTMRRIVTVNLKPLDTQASRPAEEGAGPLAETPGPGRYRLTVQVDKFRYSAPERQITTASGALAIYSERIPTTEGLRGAESRGAHWVPLGRDPLLEAYLLEQLVNARPDVTVAE